MKKSLFFLLGLSLFLNHQTRAFANMRHCLLLPISYETNQEEAFNIFSHVEVYLKESRWCHYKPNSPVFEVLSSYERNLPAALKKEEVLRVIAQKTQSGSLVRVLLKPLIRGTKVSVSVIGKNGGHIYYQEETTINTKDVDHITQTIKDHLEVYGRLIPYKGLVSGVLGDHFSIDAGRKWGVQKGRVLTLVRPLGERRHPLLKKVVTWETEIIGTGRVLKAANKTAEGRMVEYESDKRPKKGDWIKIQPSSKLKAKPEIETKIKKYRSLKDKYRFGRLGEIGLFFPLGRNSVNINNPSNMNNAAKKFGPFAGLGLTSELWFTRKWWVGMDFSHDYGLFNRKEDVFYFNGDYYLRLKGGYKYIPFGFFYGPRVDFFIGHARSKYFLESPHADAESFFSFKGLLLGGKGILPIRNRSFLYLNVEMMLSPTYEEELGRWFDLHGKKESASHFYLEFGASYRYTPRIRITGAYRILSGKAELVHPKGVLRVKNSSFTGGMIFTF